MAQARVTLRDVAGRVGVHSSTVSRVLNAETRGMVSDAVVDRVLEAVEEMGYRVNPFAYSLKTNRSFTVGVLIPDITNPIFPPIIRGIEKTLAAAGYTAILADSDEDPETENVLLQQMLARQVEGLILATAHRADEVVGECQAEGIPFVLVNRTTEDSGVFSVIYDNADGIRQAVEHIVGLGHTRIAHLAGPQNLSTGLDRYRGFLKSLQDQGLEIDEGLVFFCNSFSLDEGQRGMDALLDSGRPFTAVIAGNDMLALGCYDAMEARGINCPEDISITGFNDMPFVDKFKPPLTTVRIPHYEMGVEAAGTLLKIMSGEDPPQPEQQVLKLMVRGSTAAAPGD